jgi:hypothetical protein
VASPGNKGHVLASQSELHAQIATYRPCPKDTDFHA